MTKELPILDNHLLTHSSEQAFRTCPRLYWLRYVKGLRPKHDGDALRLGAAIHVGLDAVKTDGGEMGAVKAVRDAYADADCPPWLQPEDFDTEQETALAMVRGWWRRYADDPIVKYVASEISFDLPIVNPYTGREYAGHRNAGKIDGIAELPDGRLALVEHKTTSDEIGPASDYWQRLLIDQQISRYYLAAHELGYPVSAVVYDVLRKPQIRPKNVAKLDRHRATTERHYFNLQLNGVCPERETPRMYGARLLADLSERPEFYFARNEIPRLQSDLDQFKLDQWAAVRAISSCELDGYWPRNTGACTSPYRCQFLDVCRGLNGDPDEQVPDGFRIAGNLHPELTPAAVPEGTAA